MISSDYMVSLPRKEILGCPINDVSLDRAAEVCLDWMRNRKGAHQVVTVNVQTLVYHEDDAAVRQAIDDAELVLADGVSISLAARFLQNPICGRVVGVELTKRLLQVAAKNRLRVYFLGSTDTVLQRLIEKCRKEFDGLVIAGYRNGFFSVEQESEILTEIRKKAPDLLLVGMPSPFKETWIHRNLHSLPVRVAIGVGGSFDVLSGAVPRAPVLMQRLGLEWLWRLVLEPKKMWKRDTHDGLKYLKLLLHAVRNNRPSSAGILLLCMWQLGFDCPLFP